MFKSKLIVVLFLSLTSLGALADELPDGSYQLVAVRCNSSAALRYAAPVTYKQFSESLIQASVPGRPSLDPYYFGFSAQKLGQNLMLFWSQLHTGNATDDDRNHAPFFASFVTIGQIMSSELKNMQLIPDSIDIGYLETKFNDQVFSNEDITGRMAKDKHLGKYSTHINVSRISDHNLPEPELYEMAELDTGFGAPRNLLCGTVDAKMSYILAPVSQPWMAQSLRH